MPSPTATATHRITEALARLAAFLCALSLSAHAFAQPGPAPVPGQPLPAGPDIQVEVETPDDALHVAEEATVTVTLTHPEGITFDEPMISNTGRIQVLDHRLSAEPTTTTLTLDLAVFHIGRFYFPPLRFLYTDAEGQLRYAESPQFDLKVASLLDQGPDAASLRPTRPPTSILEDDPRPLYVGGAALAVLLCVGLGLLLARRRRSRPVAPPVTPPRPAWIVARERLAQLEEEDLPGEGRVREHYFSLSEIVREYIGSRFHFHSLELTTSELLQRLEALEWPGKLDAVVVENFLLDCDLVKFARYQPDDTMVRQGLETAHGIVDATEPGVPHSPQRDAQNPPQDTGDEEARRDGAR